MEITTSDDVPTGPSSRLRDRTLPLVILGIGLIVMSLALLWMNNWTTISPSNDSGICTEDAKLCPDGTTVGRTGPNCEFAECPETSISKLSDEWNIYTNESLQVTFHYPNNFVVKEGESPDKIFKWVNLIDESLSDPNCEQTHLWSCPGFNISMMVQPIDNTYSDKNYEIISNPAGLTFKKFKNELFKAGEWFTLVIEHNNKLYSISPNRGENTENEQNRIQIEKNLADLDQILSTFRFLNGTNNWRDYSNKQMGFSLQYPQTWQLEVADMEFPYIKILDPLASDIAVGQTEIQKGAIIEVYADSFDKLSKSPGLSLSNYLPLIGTHYPKEDIVDIYLPNIGLEGKSYTTLDTNTNKLETMGTGFVRRVNNTDMLFEVKLLIIDDDIEQLRINNYKDVYNQIVSTFRFIDAN